MKLIERIRFKYAGSERVNADYLEFMIHSSELMPGGSPYATTENVPYLIM